MHLRYLLLASSCFTWPATAWADTFRCGSQLVSTGDRAFEVERACGEPQIRDLVGYALSPNERREAVIEEWVYGPRNGMFNILTFEANRLIRIETRRAQ